MSDRSWAPLGHSNAIEREYRRGFRRGFKAALATIAILALAGLVIWVEIATAR